MDQEGRFEYSRNTERNLAMELVRVTEAAALSAGRWMGKGNKELVDQSAVDAIRHALDGVDMNGVVVIGEGEKDEAPMLYIGEQVGNGMPPEVDVAVDPVDGTRLLALGLPGASGSGSNSRTWNDVFSTSRRLLYGKDCCWTSHEKCD